MQNIAAITGIIFLAAMLILVFWFEGLDALTNIIIIIIITLFLLIILFFIVAQQKIIIDETGIVQYGQPGSFSPGLYQRYLCASK